MNQGNVGISDLVFEAFPGEITASLGKICSLEVPVLPGLLPPPTATATLLEVCSYTASHPASPCGCQADAVIQMSATAVHSTERILWRAAASRLVTSHLGAHHNQISGATGPLYCCSILVWISISMALT